MKRKTFHPAFLCLPALFVTLVLVAQANTVTTPPSVSGTNTGMSSGNTPSASDNSGLQSSGSGTEVSRSMDDTPSVSSTDAATDDEDRKLKNRRKQRERSGTVGTESETSIVTSPDNSSDVSSSSSSNTPYGSGN
jgi:hypothetical protein